jgi:benzoate membrane transport protein
VLATLGSAPAAATADERLPAAGGQREAAVVTFLVTASGVAVAGIGSAFWGLAVGVAVVLAFRPRRRNSVPLV